MPRRWLLLGCCGAGMRSLMETLLDCGQSVIGTDSQLATDSLALTEQAKWNRPGVQFLSWTRASQLLLADDSLPVDVVVSTAAISAGSPLFRRWSGSRSHDGGVRIPSGDEQNSDERGGAPQLIRLPQLTAQVFQQHQQLCVAGTHGKSTVTALLWQILECAGLSPGLFLGAEFCGKQAIDAASRSGRAGAFGAGSLAVIESCEFQRTFLNLTPSGIVLSGIDRDHFDCFADVSEENQAFQDFVQRLRPGRPLVVNAACQRSQRLVQALGIPCRTFGVDCTADVAAVNIQPAADGTSFELRLAGCGLPLRTQLLGRHNVANVAAAVAMALECGVSLEVIQHAVRVFPGIRRRLEVRGYWNGATLLDDYAHHPSAIRATLSAMRQSWPGRRILAVFEPHQVSRTASLFAEFAHVLARADESLILPVLPARETGSRTECLRMSGRLVRAVNDSGGRSFLMANLDQVVARIDHVARNGDLVVTMGAGRANLIHDEFHRRLQRNSAA
ncbi:MAG: hypothetical protein KDA85_14340 [Planctomycetaceae bacterium]|nr:hypothetical protein [Planctomycetaceae bacterium]